MALTAHLRPRAYLRPGMAIFQICELILGLGGQKSSISENQVSL